MPHRGFRVPSVLLAVGIQGVPMKRRGPQRVSTEKKQMDTLDLVRQLKQPPSSGCSLSLGLRPKGGLCCTVLVQAGKALEFWPLLILTREPTAGILGLFWASQA